MINGHTELIAHIGYPTHTFKSPMIYNPYFNEAGINAVVVPMGCKDAHYPQFLKAVFTLENIRGALITMPHKVTTVSLLDEVPGIGPSRKKALLMLFGTARAVRNASLEDLQKAPGVSAAVAQTVYDFYHSNG